MKRLRLSALAALACMAMAALSAQDNYRIAGTLVNAATGEPVVRGTISLLAESDSHTLATTHTDSQGRFSINHLPAGKYQLTAAKRGYMSAFYDEHEEYSSAVVTGSTTGSDAFVKVDQLTFNLVPGGVIRGVVTDDSGDPVEAANVRIYQKSRDHGMGARILAPASAKTDDTGAYEFGNLTPGQYMIAVTATPWYAKAWRAAPNEEGSPLDVAYPVTYFDSTTEEPAATVIDLEGGSHVEANITLHAVPALHITLPPAGRSNNGEEQESAPQLTQMIFGAPADNQMLITEAPRTTRESEFTGIAPGQYTIEAGDPPRKLTVDLANSQQIDAANGVEEASVSGNIFLTSDKPLKEQLRLVLEPVGSSVPVEMQQGTNSQNHFDFESVPPGRWTLWAANGNKSLATVALSINGKKIAGGDFTVADKPLRMDVLLADQLARVTGMVQKDGKGFPGAMVVLVPQSPAALHALVRRDQSDTDGTFNLRDVAPGKYTVLAIDDGWDLDWAKPGVLDRYLKGGVTINVIGNGGDVVTLAAPVALQPK